MDRRRVKQSIMAFIISSTIVMVFAALMSTTILKSTEVEWINNEAFEGYVRFQVSYLAENGTEIEPHVLVAGDKFWIGGFLVKVIYELIPKGNTKLNFVAMTVDCMNVLKGNSSKSSSGEMFVKFSEKELNFPEPVLGRTMDYAVKFKVDFILNYDYLGENYQLILSKSLSLKVLLVKEPEVRITVGIGGGKQELVVNWIDLVSKYSPYSLLAGVVSSLTVLVLGGRARSRKY